MWKYYVCITKYDNGFVCEENNGEVCIVDSIKDATSFHSKDVAMRYANGTLGLSNKQYIVKRYSDKQEAR